MKTRKDYFNKKCTHSEYYAQFVNGNNISLVRNAFGIEKLKEALETDINLNSIPLMYWDRLVPQLYDVNRKMKESGDFLTIAGGVCVLKECARQLVSEA